MHEWLTTFSLYQLQKIGTFSCGRRTLKIPGSRLLSFVCAPRKKGSSALPHGSLGWLQSQPLTFERGSTKHTQSDFQQVQSLLQFRSQWEVAGKQFASVITNQDVFWSSMQCFIKVKTIKSVRVIAGRAQKMQVTQQNLTRLSKTLTLY